MFMYLCVYASLHACAIKAFCEWLYSFVERAKRLMVWDLGILSSLVTMLFCCCSFTKSCPTLQPHGLQHAWLFCPLLSPRVCHLILCHPFSFCLQSFYSSESFPMSWFFTTGGQSIGASASASVLPMSSHGLCPLGWASMISLQSKGFSSVFSRTTILKQNSAFFMVQLSHLYMTTGKIIALTIQTHVSKVMTLLFNMLCIFVIAFIPRRKYLLISWLQSLSTVILEPKKIKCHSFHFSPFYLPWSDGTGSYDLSFLNVAIQISFFFSLLFHPHQESL